MQKEREKLERLVDRALKNETPISCAYEIMEKSRKINRLVNEKMGSEEK